MSFYSNIRRGEAGKPRANYHYSDWNHIYISMQSDSILESSVPKEVDYINFTGQGFSKVQDIFESNEYWKSTKEGLLNILLGLKYDHLYQIHSWASKNGEGSRLIVEIFVKRRNFWAIGYALKGPGKEEKARSWTQRAFSQTNMCASGLWMSLWLLLNHQLRSEENPRWNPRKSKPLPHTRWQCTHPSSVGDLCRRWS